MLLCRLHSNLRPEPRDLLQNQLPQLSHILDDLKVKVKRRRAPRLIRGIVPDMQIWVLEGRLNRDARRWVEGEHVVEKVQSIWVGVREEVGELPLGHVGQVAHVFLGAGRADAGECLFVGSAEDVQDLVELVDIIAAFEEGAAAEEFG